MHTKCLVDPASMLPVRGLGVDENLSYEEVPIETDEEQGGCHCEFSREWFLNYGDNSNVL